MVWSQRAARLNVMNLPRFGCLLALAAALPLLAAARDRRIDVVLTARDTADRLTPQAALTLEPLAQPDEIFPTVMVDPAKTFQTLVGIGGALTDAAAETYAQLPPERQRELLRAYFNRETGIGYSLCRIPINSCDFSSASHSYDEVDGDVELKHFSIEPDRRFRLPFIRAVLAVAGAEPPKLFASPWSPPAWMKTNGSMLQGGKLKPEYARTWAEYYGRFVRAYAAEGVALWGLTVQNEPMSAQTWESCVFTAEEERDFVRDHLGPALARAGLSELKLMIWDHNRGLLYQRAKAVYDDPEAARYVWGAAFHWYVGDHYDNVRQVRDAWPDKQLLLSEACFGRFDSARLGEWRWGEKYGTALIRDLNNGSAGWTDWNILLDERGGPNHLNGFCFAPVHADTRTGTLTYLNSYYYLGHFSKYLRPGARRVAVTTNDDRLLATAFQNPDGSIATVVLNTGDEALAFRLWIDGQAATMSAPAHSILTARY